MMKYMKSLWNFYCEKNNIINCELFPLADLNEYLVTGILEKTVKLTT